MLTQTLSLPLHDAPRDPHLIPEWALVNEGMIEKAKNEVTKTEMSNFIVVPAPNYRLL
ncbi:hypothetical protein Cyast_1935 [Cyanobacterium stanieri PCC 7202]|uniref:Uncharacterized protein n=1 Tax=Cyanobacterium stanieri (strain ATCC 29140 / PCC 7202) TaxID=292563 RepID=K9YP48_CYASC|nr:hypothetical protein Cyast_1935 [Cyanobacterium stanieri PCC 7202]